MEKEKPRPDFERYQYGALAARLAHSEESARFAPGALEVLAGGKGLNLGEDAIGFFKGTMASEQGVATAIDVYASKFEEKRGGYKPSELLPWYVPVIGDLEQKDQDKILAVLHEHNEPLSSIRETYKKADYLGKAPKGVFSEDQVKHAQQIAKQYENLFKVMAVLDFYKFETLRGDAVDETRKKELKNLASKL